MANIPDPEPGIPKEELALINSFKIPDFEVKVEPSAVEYLEMMQQQKMLMEQLMRMPPSNIGVISSASERELTMERLRQEREYFKQKQMYEEALGKMPIDKKLLKEMKEFAEDPASRRANKLRDKIMAAKEKKRKEIEDDIEPEWEMDLAAGAFQPGDIVVDEQGNQFYVVSKDKPLAPIESGQPSKPQSSRMQRVHSTFAEGGTISSGEAWKPGDPAGTVTEIPYKPLTSKMLEELTESIMKGSEPPPYVRTGVEGTKEFHKALREEAKKMFEEVGAYPVPTDDDPGNPIPEQFISYAGTLVPLHKCSTEALEEALAQVLRGDLYDMTMEETLARRKAISMELGERKRMVDQWGKETKVMNEHFKSPLGLVITRPRALGNSKGLLEQIRDDVKRSAIVTIDPLPPSPGGGRSANEVGDTIRGAKQWLRKLFK